MVIRIATSISCCRGPIAVTTSKLWPENSAYDDTSDHLRKLVACYAGSASCVARSQGCEHLSLVFDLITPKVQRVIQTGHAGPPDGDPRFHDLSLHRDYKSV